MEIGFHRTGERRYAVEVRRPGAPVLRMDPAPGFDELFPHDLQHLIVEEQLGLLDGIYGRLHGGGTASTFQPVRPAGATDKRRAARLRRKLERRNTSLAARGPNDFARSERATCVAWHDWLAHSDDPGLRARGDRMAMTAERVVARMGDDERSRVLAALPRIRERISVVTAEWAATEIGGSMTITWAPVSAR